MKLRVLLLSLGLTLTACFSGCVSASDHSTTKQPTTGQELIDLKNAYDLGALTDAEYEVEKAKILNQRTQ